MWELLGPAESSAPPLSELLLADPALLCPHTKALGVTFSRPASPANWGLYRAQQSTPATLHWRRDWGRRRERDRRGLCCLFGGKQKTRVEHGLKNGTFEIQDETWLALKGNQKIYTYFVSWMLNKQYRAGREKHKISLTKGLNSTNSPSHVYIKLKSVNGTISFKSSLWEKVMDKVFFVNLDIWLRQRCCNEVRLCCPDFKHGLKKW